VNGVSGLRASGILLHPTSLPGGPIGDLGPAAYRFIDWLADAGQSYWQILPLVAVDEGGSPYNGLSAVAGNPFLVSFDGLVADGLLRPEDADGSAFEGEPLDFARVARWKEERLRRAYLASRDGASPGLTRELERYRVENAAWLEDYTLFRALRAAHAGARWTEWPAALRDRRPPPCGRPRRSWPRSSPSGSSSSSSSTASGGRCAPMRTPAASA
jgi:4-alpha-glucanotransferase